MSRPVTLANIRARVRELADIEGTSGVAYVSDAKLLEYINHSIGVWHSKLVDAVPERYATSTDITATGAASYNLPADYYGTLYVEEVIGTNRRELARIMPHERNVFGHDSSPALGYEVRTGTLKLYPLPASGTYRHHYVTHAPELSADGDTLDGINGWEAWIWLDVACYVLLKQRSDISQLMAKKQEIEAAMTTAAADRIKGNPKRVVDVRPAHLRGPGKGGFYYGDIDFWRS